MRGGKEHSTKRPEDVALEALVERLRDRLEEIEEAVRARVYAIADAGIAEDPTYAPGLREAVSVAMDYALAGISRHSVSRQEVPMPLLMQARLAARSGVSLDTVLRRYFAGYVLINDALIEEGTAAGLDREDLKEVLRHQATLFDRVLASVSTEFQRESTGLVSPEHRRIEAVRRLLDGEFTDSADLGYPFDGHHLAFVTVGPGGDSAIRRIAESLDRRLLLIGPDRTTTWGWLGGRRTFDVDQLAAVIRSCEENSSEELAIACGEPGRNLAAWRLSHRQALAALPVARRIPSGFARYRDVALLAAVLQDDLLIASLRKLYLDPLAQGRDRGESMRATLRAYLASDRNVSSAAAALGVSRNTVNRRLRAAEEMLNRPIELCAVDLETALRIDELGI